ncbi:MAG: LptF/LptG family permease [Spirochaetaceae bacterium]|nr:LptF/LptG family permease [Spirochaetaceae bacterium]
MVIKPTLERYIWSEFLLSFLVSFLFYFLVFFLNQLLLMAQVILAKGIPLGSVLLLMLYSLPSFITLSAPFATLTAALMAYGRFSSDNEVLAMRSAGFRRSTIFRPVLVLGILVSFISFGVNDILLPAGTKAFQRLWIELSLTHPGLELEPFSVRMFRQSVLVTGAIDEEGIHPMIIIERDGDGNRSSIMAARAAPEIRGRQNDFPGFRMHDVFSLTPDSAAKDEWTWSTADYMDYRLLTSDNAILDQQSGPANMRVREIRLVIREKAVRHKERLLAHRERQDRAEWNLSLNYARLSQSRGSDRLAAAAMVKRHAAEIDELAASLPRDHSLQVWKLEYYQKFAIPFACIPFVVLAFPLGLTAKRSGRAVGFFIGLLITSFYWSLLVLGRSLGLRTNVSPFLVMIVPDLLLLAAGVVLYMRRSHA